MKIVCRKCRRDFEGSLLKPLLGASAGAIVGLALTPTIPLIKPLPPDFPWFPVVIINNRPAACVAGAVFGWMSVKSRMLCPACKEEQQEVSA